MHENEFKKLLSSCTEMSEMFPDGLVYIGGIAVYLHAVNNEKSDFAEFTHDADFYIAVADIADLRDIEELTANRRLSKHQFIKNGFEFDVYTERQSSLIVPYDAVASKSVQYGSCKVASLEHLFALKMEAYRDRCNSAKGAKDAKDLVRISVIGERIGFDNDLLSLYLNDDHIDLLDRVKTSPEIITMANGNAVVAKQYRRAFSVIMDAQKEAHKASLPKPRG